MSTLRELKPITNHHAFNVARWQELCADPALAALKHSRLCPDFPGFMKSF